MSDEEMTYLNVDLDQCEVEESKSYAILTYTKDGMVFNTVFDKNTFEHIKNRKQKIVVFML
jgi:hypothetical protein